MKQALHKIDKITIDWDMISKMSKKSSVNDSKPSPQSGEAFEYDFMEEKTFENFGDAFCGVDLDDNGDELKVGVTSQDSDKTFTQETETTLTQDLLDDFEKTPGKKRRADGMRPEVSDRCNSGHEKNARKNYLRWWRTYAKYCQTNEEMENKEVTVCQFLL